MNKLELLTNALEYIETNITSDIKTEDVARACFCSKASLEKLFRCLNHISVHDYVIRRRMTIAGRMLASDKQSSVLEIAVALGYSTNESFSRAFKKVWQCNPSQFRENPRRFELFPKLNTPVQREGEELIRKSPDISELYELFRQRRSCYFVCCDVAHLVPINEISTKAGDIAILEAMRRMEAEAGEEDMVFRIGGDEFAILTKSEDSFYAEEIAERIRRRNGECFEYEGKQIPLALHIAVARFGEGSIGQSQIYQKLLNVIMETQK